MTQQQYSILEPRTQPVIDALNAQESKPIDTLCITEAHKVLETGTGFDPRTRLLLEAPIARTLLRLAMPNVLVMVVQASVGLIETYFIGKLGTEALAGVALVFPVVMLMQMMSAGAMGGGISSAIARAIGAGRRADADALVLHALAIAVVFGFVFMLAVLGGGRWLYGVLGGSGMSLAAALTYSNVVSAGAILVWIFNALANVIRGTGNMALPAAVTCVGAAVVANLQAQGVRAAAFKADQTDTAQVEILVKQKASIALGRFGRLEEIAAGVVFLASPEASFVTGTVLNVDGGFGA